MLLNTIEKLKKIEKQSGNTTDKYIPIYTSKIIEDLEPEFKFITGIQYHPGSSRHQVILRYENNDILIENSFDGKRSFRFSFLSNRFIIPLKLDKVVHRGSNAKELTHDLLINKTEIIKSIENAKKLVYHFQSTKIPKKIKNKIFSIVFEKHLKNKNVDITIAKSYNTIFSYTETIVDRFLEGEYYLIDNKSKIKKGRKIKSKFAEIVLINRIYKTLKSEHPEIFI